MAQTFASASASASTSTSASASASAPMYDVFLNHRGIDVKKTLASHMYRSLLSHGLKVFLDQPELQQGEALTPQIEKAIASSSVQVAIFSTQYAESNWCLDELVRMLLESKRSGATIIPVFFNVQPSDLRWPDKGRYAQSLLAHESKGRYNKETLADWRAALAEVSHISGFELNSCNGDEGELVEKVVQQVMKKVKKPPLHVAVHPTGLDNKLNDFERKVLLQQQHSGQAKVVGIVGIGGVGKTTMAKEFFNRKRSSYGRSSFLAEVRGAAARSSLTSLQSQLYEDLTGCAGVMNSVDEGTGMLRRLLSCSRVLIILDDVDHADQVLAFVQPGNDVLHSGSLIIVTSRNKEVFTVLGIEVSSIYKMEGLDKKHSQLLFCLHAFNKDLPVVEFEEVVGKFLKLCAGLPLSLKVLGSLLRGKKDLGYWEGQRQKIFKSGLPKDIQSILRISYDSLEEEEKNIFLDIACFFIGTKKDTAIRIWDGSGWEGSVGLLNLEYKCLVEIDRENCIRMHDQLRDLGRYLAEKEPLGSGLRLWRPTDSLFRNVPPQSTVRGIMIDLESGEECSNHIVDMRGLQLLSAPLAFLESISEVLRKADLVWLSIRNIYLIPCLPSWIPIRNLRVLELGGLYGYDFFNSKPVEPLQTLWETENEPEPRVETLWETVETLWETVETTLTSLEMQRIKGLSGIECLRELNNLEVLTVRECPIREMPFASVEKAHKCMVRLKRLELTETRITEISFGEGVCPNLQEFILLSCRELGEIGALPTTLSSVDTRNCGALNNLEVLTVRECPIREVPFASVEKAQKCMVQLKRLELTETRITEISFGEGVCPNLRELKLLDLTGTRILELATTLTSLYLHDCSALNRILNNLD